jgi:hypothetical protein
VHLFSWDANWLMNLVRLSAYVNALSIHFVTLFFYQSMKELGLEPVSERVEGSKPGTNQTIIFRSFY